jgi:hypothetical protein
MVDRNTSAATAAKCLLQWSIEIHQQPPQPNAFCNGRSKYISSHRSQMPSTMVDRNTSAATAAKRLLQHGDSGRPVRMQIGTPTIATDYPTSLLQILPVKQATITSSVAFQIH